MKYITGIHALNLPCSLPTFGDWHRYGIQWKNLTIRDTEKSIFGDYGIEEYSKVPEHPGTFKVANHIRALLDMLAEGQFGYAQGMRKDFRHCCKVSDEAAFCLIQRPYISKTLLTRRISPRGSP